MSPTYPQSSQSLTDFHICTTNQSIWPMTTTHKAQSNRDHTDMHNKGHDNEGAWNQNTRDAARSNRSKSQKIIWRIHFRM